MARSENLVVIDIETTGTSLGRDEVTALALVPVDHGTPPFECYVRTPETEDKLAGVAREYFDSYATEWTRNAVSPAEAGRRLLDYLKSNDLAPVTLVGHNVAFDLGFLKKMAEESGVDLAGWISHRAVDTHSLLHTLYTLGEIEKEDLTSGGAFQRFGIDFSNGGRHTALGDAIATRSLYKALIDRFRALGNRQLRKELAQS
ncbi:MAG: DNA polymerase-3 subunit epsilon [Rhodothermales bacterium]|jgi:DNA polymerase-3 subunit epsilon